jgi:hypothetical protein
VSLVLDSSATFNGGLSRTARQSASSGRQWPATAPTPCQSAWVRPWATPVLAVQAHLLGATSELPTDDPLTLRVPGRGAQVEERRTDVGTQVVRVRSGAAGSSPRSPRGGSGGRRSPAAVRPPRTCARLDPRSGREKPTPTPSHSSRSLQVQCASRSQRRSRFAHSLTSSAWLCVALFLMVGGSISLRT